MQHKGLLILSCSKHTLSLKYLGFYLVIKSEKERNELIHPFVYSDILNWYKVTVMLRHL